LFDNKWIFHRQIDTSEDGVVQTDGVTVDVEQTIQRLNGLFEERSNSWIQRERRWIQEQEITMLAADAPFLLGPLAEECKVPAVAISNFLWDSIYQGFPAMNSKLMQQVQQCYRGYKLWIRESGWLTSPSFEDALAVDKDLFLTLLPSKSDNRWIADVPPVVRLPKETDRRHVLETLFTCHPEWSLTEQEKQRFFGISELPPWKLLLVTFGGHVSKNHLRDAKVRLKLPPHWIALLVNVPWIDAENERRIFTVNGQHPSLYFPDLTVACDAVLGKLGYGTCGDCIAAAQTPMIYVRRKGFVEEEGLLQLMSEYNGGRIVEMSMEQFRQGQWNETLRQVETEFLQEAIPETNPPKGDVDIVDLLFHFDKIACQNHQ
jgi:L-arabinokinase